MCGDFLRFVTKDTLVIAVVDGITKYNWWPVRPDGEIQYDNSLSDKLYLNIVLQRQKSSELQSNSYVSWW